MTHHQKYHYFQIEVKNLCSQLIRAVPACAGESERVVLNPLRGKSDPWASELQGQDFLLLKNITRLSRRHTFKLTHLV